MKILQLSALKTILSAGLVVALLGTTVGCTTVTPDYDNQQVYRQKGNNNNRNGRYDNHNGRYNNNNERYNSNKGRYNNNNYRYK
ncbi:hypothetical protein [Psychrobacter frigidicola]|uniref:hypothetical protein n=1 Tax=Psychrobacter frigidicola TaxID=45611 RepID=UPI001918C704|nr:hypothetical protein [Psychrobacter frigidicola]